MRLGLASPRVVVRQIEMPVMTRDELASALQFQAARAHPDPDRRRGARLRDPRTGAARATAASRRMHVLLAAAQEATVLRLVAAVEAGGL